MDFRSRALHAHHIRKVGRRGEHRLKNFCFAGQQRCNAGTVTHADAVAVDNDADGLRAGEIAAAAGRVAVLKQDDIALLTSVFLQKVQTGN